MNPSTVVVSNRGPAVRFKSNGTGTVRVVSHGKVTKVALSGKSKVRLQAA
jgi:hypothetical protein